MRAQPSSFAVSTRFVNVALGVAIRSTRFVNVALALATCALVACSSNGGTSGSGATGDASSGTGASAATTSAGGTGGAATGGSSSAGAGGTSSASGGGGVSSSSGTGGAAPSFESEVITARHRFIPGKMFGGWGPHLGHLVRAKTGASATALFWVDDVCSQAGGAAPVCDVNKDSTIGIFRRDGNAWSDLGVTSLPGTVQQNTGSLESGGVLRTYGVDVTGHLLQECTYNVATSARGCAALGFTLDPFANYIGAAVSPQGYRMVWWTDVGDGGGGHFEFIVDYGGGWNGPRKGDVQGYNDSSYIHIAFRADSTAFTMHTQLVSGLAPNWSYLGAVGEGDSAKDAPVAWQNALAAPAGDSVESTDDIYIDPATSDTHLFARAKSGAALYYFRPKGGAWSASLFAIPAAYRLRFAVSPSGLGIVYGLNGKGLHYRVVPPEQVAAGKPVDWASHEEQAVPLPDGYQSIDAIYPESTVYQTAPVEGMNVAVVGDARQYEALFVAIHP